MPAVSVDLRVSATSCVVLLLSLTVMIATGCGGKGSTENGLCLTSSNGSTATPTTTAPSFNELNVALQAEFDRLGIDPDKVTAAAPSGDKNAVFDLTATVIDPDGEGPQDPTGIELTWTERLLGDYNQNGMVEVGDLTPIAVYWEQAIAHEQSALHGGIDYWPDGDPDGTGAGNWRLARADGNDNGLIEIADISTIAQHWEERISGYRIYRKAPGAAGFTWIADPADAQQRHTISRPAATAGAPVRYSFTDSPAVPGAYEYYVIGFAEETTSSSMEGSAPSNTVAATLNLSGIDIHPPEWDSTVGATSATANIDGTITVEWGTATDNAHPPAVATPPVSYTLYYSTETPIDFETAYSVEDAVSPWTSAQLVEGREYYFAVQAQDSAEPVNVDENIIETSAMVTGGVVDEEPPAWTGVTIEDYDGSTKPLTGGLAAVEVGDGKLTIHCTPAEDILSPPVHYDLYCMSLSGLDDYSTRPADWDMYTNTAIPHENAIIIKDIPQVYELEWENRCPVSVMVVTRDSAIQPNCQWPSYHGYTAPSDVAAVEIDPEFPWVLDGQLSTETSISVVDATTQTLYTLFAPQPTGGIVNKYRFYFLKRDLLKGTWEAKFMYENPLLEQPVIFGSALAPNGDFFVQVRFIRHLGDVYDQYWRINTADGSYALWEPGLDIGDWYNDQLGHNGLPSTTVYKESTVDPEYYSAWYRWYDDVAGSWKEELASDPGGTLYTLTRPDGVMQSIVYGTKIAPDLELPIYGTILERDIEGNWSEIYRFGDDRIVGHYRSVSCATYGRSGYANPSWGTACDWVVTVGIDDLTDKIITYSYNSGYAETIGPALEDHFPFIREGAIHGSGMSIRLSCNSEYRDYIINKSNIDMRWHKSVGTGEFMKLSYSNPQTGDYSYWYGEHDVATGEYKYYIRSSYYGNASIYDPLDSDWN